MFCIAGDKERYGGGFLKAAGEKTYLSLLNIFLMNASTSLEFGSENMIGTFSLFILLCMLGCSPW